MRRRQFDHSIFSLIFYQGKIQLIIYVDDTINMDDDRIAMLKDFLQH